MRVKTDLKKVWYEIVDRINLAQDKVQWLAVVSTVMKLLVP
jgi:hypothetical protein